MRIAVIADTHDRLPDRLLPLWQEADQIWHLGDVCDPSVLDGLNILGPKLRVVQGNCDEGGIWPLTLDFTLEGFRIHLVHIPPSAPPLETDLVFHGHTHVPRYERWRGADFFNPGCITRPNRGAPASWAWLDLQKGKPIGWTLNYV